MREIKFRQPRISKGKFLYWHYWGFITDGHFAAPETNSSTIAATQEKSQQLTGLLDKNGKEIYEGDILKSCATGLLFAVTWWAEKAMFRAVIGNILLDSAKAWKNSEIIGNIYENPELLEGK